MKPSNPVEGRSRTLPFRLQRRGAFALPRGIWVLLALLAHSQTALAEPNERIDATPVGPGSRTTPRAAPTPSPERVDTAPVHAAPTSTRLPANQGETEPPANESDTKPPALIRFVEAKLPTAAALTTPLTVLLELTVTEDGEVQDIVVLTDAEHTLIAAVTQAVAQFRFTPAEVLGEPRAVRIRYEYVLRAQPEPTLPNEQAASGAKLPPEAAAAPTPPKAVGRLEGRVLQRGTRKPLIGAKVSLPEYGRETLTDADGRFSFDAVPARQVSIRVSDAEHTTIDDYERVAASEVTDITYYASPSGFEEDDLVVVGRRDRKLVTRRELSQRELATTPGANGDFLAAVQNLPGVARVSGVSRVPGDRLVFRGEANGRAYINGFAVQNPFHFEGIRSALGNGAIESIHVDPGNYDARYGNATSGVLSITTKPPAHDTLHGFAQVDLFDASMRLEGPVSEHSSVAIAGRRSYIDGVLALALSDEDSQSIATAPRYYDAQASYDYNDAGHEVQVHLIGVDDRLALLLDEPPESEPRLRGRVGSHAQWAMAQILWDYRISELTTLHHGIALTRNRYEVELGQSIEADFVDYESGFRSELEHEFASWLSTRVGVNVETQHYDYEVISIPAAEEGRPLQNLSTQPRLATSEAPSVYNPAAHLAFDLRLGSLLLVPSVRIDHFSRRDELAGDTLVQPHLDLRWAATESTVLKGGIGLYSRAPWIYQSNDVFGNPGLEPERSLQASAGFEYRCTRWVSLDVVGFYNHLSHQVSPVLDPAVGYDNRGRGRTYGGEFLLKHDPGKRFYGWLAYTLSRSERKESGQGEFVLADYDQTHNVNIVGQYRINHKWELGARFRYVTGNPTTPVIAASFDSDVDAYTPIYGALNSERNGAFHQLDVRVDRHFVFDTWRLTTYLDLQNAYNHANPDGRSYNFDYSRWRPSTGLPLIPAFGLRGEF